MIIDQCVCDLLRQYHIRMKANSLTNCRCNHKFETTFFFLYLFVLICICLYLSFIFFSLLFPPYQNQSLEFVLRARDAVRNTWSSDIKDFLFWFSFIQCLCISLFCLKLNLIHANKKKKTINIFCFVKFLVVLVCSFFGPVIETTKSTNTYRCRWAKKWECNANTTQTPHKSYVQTQKRLWIKPKKKREENIKCIIGRIYLLIVEVYSLLTQINITILNSEVVAWTRFTDETFNYRFLLCFFFSSHLS